MTTRNDAIRAVQSTLGTKQDRIEWKTATLGDGHGTVSTGNNMVYCRLTENSSVIEVLNLRVSPVDGLRVRIAKTPEMPRVWQVIGQEDQRVDENGNLSGGGVNYSVPPHSALHGYLAPDQANIDWRQITNLRVYAYSGLTIGVLTGIIPRSGADLVVASQTLDLTSHVPATSPDALYCLISVDSTGALVATDGSTKSGRTNLLLTDIPDTPTGNFRLAAVRLYNGQTSISETTALNDIRDLRWPQEKLATAVSPGDMALANTHIFVGNASGVAADVAMSGDATIANTGAVTLKNTGPGATGPIGSASSVPVITIDAQGRVTALSSASITTGIPIITSDPVAPSDGQAWVLKQSFSDQVGYVSGFGAYIRINTTIIGYTYKLSVYDATAAAIKRTRIGLNGAAVKSTDYTLTPNDQRVTFTATATATLRESLGTGEQEIRLICRAGTLTITAKSGSTIKGETTQTLYAGEDLILCDTAAGVYE